MSGFQPSTASHERQVKVFYRMPTIARRNGDIVSTIYATQVRDSSDMVEFIDLVRQAIPLETRASLDSDLNFVFISLGNRAKAANDSVKEIAPIFKDLRNAAQMEGASRVDQAVLNAAAWYYNNVEKPALQQSTVSGAASAIGKATTASGLGAQASGSGFLASSGERFYQRSGFKIGLLLTAALGIGAAIIFWPSRDKEGHKLQAAPKVPAKTPPKIVAKEKPATPKSLRRVSTPAIEPTPVYAADDEPEDETGPAPSEVVPEEVEDDGDYDTWSAHDDEEEEE